MKVIKKVGIFVVIALIIQTAVLLYFNNVYFSSNTAVIASSGDSTSGGSKKEITEKEKTTAVEIPDNAQIVRASCDGQYIAYEANSNVYILNLNSGKTNMVPFPENTEINCYSWAQDKADLIIGEKEALGSGTVLKLTSYDTSTTISKQLKDLSWLGNNICLADIKFGKDIDDMFIKTKDDKDSYNIYHLGNENKKFELMSTNIEDYLPVGESGEIIYQVNNDKRLYITGKSAPLNIKSNNKLLLLGEDDKGYVYAGPEKDDKFDKIYKIRITQKSYKYTTKSLPVDVKLQDINISSTGKIYLNDEAKSKVVEIIENKTYDYKGKLVDFYDDGIIINNDNKFSEIQF